MTQKLTLKDFGSIEVMPFIFHKKNYIDEREREREKIELVIVEAVNLRNSKTLNKGVYDGNIAYYNENNVGLYIGQYHIDKYKRKRLKEYKELFESGHKLNTKERDKFEEDFKKEFERKFFDLVSQEIHKDIN